MRCVLFRNDFEASLNQTEIKFGREPECRVTRTFESTWIIARRRNETHSMCARYSILESNIQVLRARKRSFVMPTRRATVAVESSSPPWQVGAVSAGKHAGVTFPTPFMPSEFVWPSQQPFNLNFAMLRNAWIRAPATCVTRTHMIIISDLCQSRFFVLLKSNSNLSVNNI